MNDSTNTPETGAIPASVYAEVIGEVRNTLAFMKRCGVEGVDLSESTMALVRNFGRPLRPNRSLQPPVQPQVQPRSAGKGSARPVSASAPSHPSPAISPPAAEKPSAPESLAEIRKALGDCTRCPLCKGRRNIVFGDGNPNARLMFIGEGPGFDEEMTGRPFAGKAGQLLTDIITKGMKLQQEAVYIANIVKCRPPNNRHPLPNEIAVCYPFLQSQIRAIQPDAICVLGEIAAQVLLGSPAPITQLRGKFHTYGNIPVMPTFHPAFLLRQTERKRETWQDVKALMARMGISGQ